MAERIEDLLQWRVIPAFPGYYSWSVGDNGELFDREPVIGWQIEQRRTSEAHKYFWWTKPLIATSHDTDDERTILELPDGTVYIPEDRMCKSLDEAREYLKRESQ